MPKAPPVYRPHRGVTCSPSAGRIVWTHAHIHTHTHARICIHAYMHAYTCLCAFMRACIAWHGMAWHRMAACMHACMYKKYLELCTIQYDAIQE